MTNQTADAEFEAIQTIYSALKPLEEGARGRVMEYVSNRLGIATQAKAPVTPPIEPKDSEASEQDSVAGQSTGLRFDTLAELFDAAQPKTQPDKALVCGYWLQVCQSSDSFDGFSVNKDLKNLGEGIPNITNALDALKNQKPALALQLKKNGKSQQARKVYKITVAGIKSVETMING